MFIFWLPTMGMKERYLSRFNGEGDVANLFKFRNPVTGTLALDLLALSLYLALNAGRQHKPPGNSSPTPGQVPGRFAQDTVSTRMRQPREPSLPTRFYLLPPKPPG